MTSVNQDNLSEAVVVSQVRDRSSSELFQEIASQNDRLAFETDSLKSGHFTGFRSVAKGSTVALNYPRGCELFVWSGGVADDNGQYRAGYYLRLPPDSQRLWRASEDSILFVKENQSPLRDLRLIAVDTIAAPWYQGQGDLKVMPLYQFENHNTALVHWPAGERFLPHVHYGGEEIFVIQGQFCDEHGIYEAGTWLRNPHLSRHHPYVEEETVILVKTGHLVP